MFTRSDFKPNNCSIIKPLKEGSLELVNSVVDGRLGKPFGSLCETLGSCGEPFDTGSLGEPIGVLVA